MSPKNQISIVIATYHGQEYMPGLFESIQQQTLQPIEVIIIDNSSDSLTREAIITEGYEADIYPQKSNLDFGRGYNLGMQKARGEFILILNQDLVLAPNAIELLVDTLNHHPDAAAIAPKLLRLEDEKTVQESLTIDGMGLTADKKRRFVNIGEGEQDKGQYDHLQEVFGLSGAVMLFRREALQDIAQHGGGDSQEYFDDQFISYKEDIDLSYRFQHRGWKLRIEPKAVMYHKRTAQESKQGVTDGVFENRKQKSFRIRGNSLRNHWWFLIKNEPLINLIVHFPWIGYYELGKLCFTLVFERSTLAILPSFFKSLPNMLKKRRAILRSSKISASQLRKWFT